MSSQSVLQSIKYTRGALKVLDQLKVPHELTYRDVLSVEDGIDSIKTMQVRGAPLIAMVGCLSVAVELCGSVGQGLKDNVDLMKYLRENIEALIEARPTAVNMRKEGHKLVELAEGWSHNTGTEELKVKIISYIEELLTIDVKDNTSIGLFGAEAILKKGKLEGGKAVVITHCNTGSLATAGYGTALGVIRALHEQGKLEHVYFTETRPYNQGARLTAFELLHDKIPSTLICDSAASYLMKSKLVSAIVVGADRVTRNGDTANKVGTYQLAVSANAHGVPFFIAAPFSSIDGTIETGDDIVIEQRSPEEVTTVRGIRVAPEGVQVWNPAFDVTPAALIEGIVTERGVYKPDDLVNHLCAGTQL